MGQNSTFVINGDLKQNDLWDRNDKLFHDEIGLYDVITKLENINGVSHVKLQNSDIVRDPFIGVLAQALDE
jgi:phosphate starvation-inducible protein PhoH